MTTQPPNDDALTPASKLAAAGPGQMWGWANWQAWEAGYPPLGGVEYTLYTDASLLMGEASEGLGPYQLLRTGTPDLPLGNVLPALVLRADHYIHPAVLLGDTGGNRVAFNPKVIRLLGAVEPIDSDLAHENWPRNVDAYHGGQVADELASLISLVLGIRLESGGLTRVFGMDGAPRGRPIEYFRPDYRLRRLHPLLPDRLIPHRRLQVDDPTAAWIHLADCVPWLQRYFRLRQDHANAIVRAARSYQAAMWAAAEEDPRQAWLKLIGEVEVAAHHWVRGDASPAEQLHAVEPELAERLQAAGDGLLEAVAERFAPGLRTTRRMLTFTLQFLPPPPDPRPTVGALAWPKNKMRKHLKTIYGVRSEDLHAGIPVPPPMCEPPTTAKPEQAEGSRYESYENAWTEIPSGRWAAVATSVWQAEDTPMLLHTFEYIVRNVLMNWWESMDPAAPSGDDQQSGTRSS
jgi:hypothetical protein